MSISSYDSLELIKALSDADFSLERIAERLRRQGHDVTRQTVYNRLQKIKHAPDNVIFEATTIEERIRTSVVLLRVASRTDERAKEYYAIYLESLIASGSVLTALDSVKEHVRRQKKIKKVIRESFAGGALPETADGS